MLKSNYQSIKNKLNHNNFNLIDEFNDLRKITHDYEIPSDVCESYEAVYNMLEKLDNSYSQVK